MAKRKMMKLSEQIDLDEWSKGYPRLKTPKCFLPRDNEGLRTKNGLSFPRWGKFILHFFELKSFLQILKLNQGAKNKTRNST
jgi:hypothetical protein